MGRRPWSVDCITGVPDVPERDEVMMELTFGGAGTVGSGLGPEFIGAEGMRGNGGKLDNGSTGEIGVGVGGGRGD
jgi:hypothetical protein